MHLHRIYIKKVFQTLRNMAAHIDYINNVFKLVEYTKIIKNYQDNDDE